MDDASGWDRSMSACVIGGWLCFGLRTKYCPLNFSLVLFGLLLVFMLANEAWMCLRSLNWLSVCCKRRKKAAREFHIHCLISKTSTTARAMMSPAIGLDGACRVSGYLI